jgi:hypothetical protein
MHSETVTELQRGARIFNDVFRERAAQQGVELLLYGMAICDPSPAERQIDYLVLPRNGPRMKVQIETGLVVGAARDAAAAATQIDRACDGILRQLAPVPAAA